MPLELSTLLQPADIIAELVATTKSDVLAELASQVAERHPGLERDELVRVLLERERLGSTGIGDGIAIPHGKLKQARELVLAFGRSRNGVEFSALDGQPVRLFFMLIAPQDAVGIHLKMLARISRILKDPGVRRRLMEVADAVAIHQIIQEQDSHQ
ncbi:PTS sugar transporter subunit IIA [Geobacter sp. AOG1]|uniref:PTS sugar transporter subunit IIA n=1 Tax=Geobacter sp. AOG1 TaxID=1566346 RepID=UPI001CC64B42|nr:PTS sugar transporter subunit IIA [Geobacter sp. AOG1]GFE59372.1 PTS fructose transporter subunit IIA [Geobacter sp. AOG1]